MARKKVFTDFEAFTEFRTSCEKYGISFDLLSMTPDPSQSAGSSQDWLTDRQREALTLAVSRGYYESPRQVTTQELAEEKAAQRQEQIDAYRDLSTSTGTTTHK